MTEYDDLFEDTATSDSVFADKSALDPLAEPDEIVARESQEREIASLLQGVHEGYLPQTVSIYGPPGTGKTITTRRVCRAFADRTPEVAVEYVNLKECRSLFSAANEIHFELTGEKLGAYQGLDGVFTGIWDALDDYPEWTVLLLDEIDHVQQDSNYDPSDFFYRLFRGEGKLARDINLSTWLISNELLTVDLRLDSRVQSAMSGEEVFFPPYDRHTLEQVLQPRVETAFHDDAITEDAFDYGVAEAARRWGDARQALTLFRQAGETANEHGEDTVTEASLDASFDATEKEAVTEKLLSLPFNHFHILVGLSFGTNPQTGEIAQPLSTDKLHDVLTEIPGSVQLSERTIRSIVNDLETTGLVNTWMDNRGSEGRVKKVETAFDPQWVQDAMNQYAKDSPYMSAPEE